MKIKIMIQDGMRLCCGCNKPIWKGEAYADRQGTVGHEFCIESLGDVLAIMKRLAEALDGENKFLSGDLMLYVARIEAAAKRDATYALLAAVDKYGLLNERKP